MVHIGTVGVINNYSRGGISILRKKNHVTIINRRKIVRTLNFVLDRRTSSRQFSHQEDHGSSIFDMHDKRQPVKIVIVIINTKSSF